MMYCDSIAERLAAGEPLSAENQRHLEICPACARLMALPPLVARTVRPVEPTPGFASRMTAGAQRRVVVRRRRRVAVMAAATACVLIAGAGLGNYAHRRLTAAPGAVTLPVDYEPWPARDADDAAVEQELLTVIDVDSSLRFSARWDTIEEPLAPLRDLLKAGMP